jgi:hypothetical protein
MNLAEIESTFRSDNGDEVEPYLWSSKEVARWANEAEQEACIRRRLISDKTSGASKIKVVEGKTVYTLNDSVLEILHAALIDEAGTHHPISSIDSIELDRIRPSWRTDTRRPAEFIHNDKTLELSAKPDAAYTLQMEVYRLPAALMEGDEDTPEIHASHHLYLLHWIEHRAYAKPDVDTMNTGKSESAAQEFERYFGPRPSADLRRKRQANRAHRNKAYW